MLDDEGRARLEAGYRSFGDELWRALLAFSGRRDVADDCVAEAFAQAARRLGAIRDLKAWVYRSAFKIAAGELKRSKEHAASPAAEELPGSEPAGEAGGVVKEIVEMARDLSPRQRRVFVLRDVLGYSTSETASLLDSSEVSVRVHLHAARKRLRDELESEEAR